MYIGLIKMKKKRKNETPKNKFNYYINDRLLIMFILIPNRMTMVTIEIS